jgi:hypothetical protein
MRDVASTEGHSFSLHVHTGRLIEARVFALRTVEHAEAYGAALLEVARRVHTGTPVLLADHRPVVIYPQDVAERLVDLFTRMYTRLARVAIIASRSNATMAMQIERLVREAKEAKRRVMYAPSDACEHLRTALDAAELARAQDFLAEWSPE